MIIPCLSIESHDEGEWRKVNVPHDFQIEQPWVAPSADEKADNTDVAANIKSRLSSRGFKEMGKGYYRLHYTPAKELEGQRVLLDFEGIMYTADVYLNRRAGLWQGQPHRSSSRHPRT